MAKAQAIDGFLDLSKYLAQVAGKVADKALQAKACEAGAEVVRKESQRIINQKTTPRTHRLETGVATERNDAEGAAYVGWAQDAFYGRFMETGTKKMPARPHIRPGLEQKKEQVVRAMLDVLRGEMEE